MINFNRIDLAEVEQKVLAANACGEDMDPHTTLAAQVLGKDVSLVTEHERRLAKVINFYYWYGDNNEL